MVTNDSVEGWVCLGQYDIVPRLGRYKFDRIVYCTINWGLGFRV